MLKKPPMGLPSSSAALPRPRPTFRARLLALYAWLDARALARPLLLACVAVWVAVLATPDLRLTRAPMAEAREGLPATENIKAPWDLELVDQETTTRLREEARSQVRSVWDFDTEVVQRLQAHVAQAFALGRALPVGTTGRALFTQKLGVPVPDPVWQAFVDLRFSEAVEAALEHLVTAVQQEPVVASMAQLALDQARGIVLHRLPAASGSAALVASRGRPVPLIIDDINMVRDLAAAQAQVLRLARYLGDHGELIGPAADRYAHGPELADMLGQMAQALLSPNLTLNRAETQTAQAQAQNQVPQVQVTIKKGEMVVRDGERLTARHLMVLRGFDAGSGASGGWARAMGGGVLAVGMGVLAALTMQIVRRDRMRLHARDLIFLAAVFVVSLTVCRTWLALTRSFTDLHGSVGRNIWLYCMPVSLGAMLTRLVLRTEVALLFAVTHSLTLALLADGDRALSLYGLAGAVAAIVATRTISARSDLLRAGLWAAAAQAGVGIGLQLHMGLTRVPDLVLVLPAALVGGLVASIVALSITPLVEWTFDYTTDLKLLELANLNHPALKDLIVQAPGSYHHSIVVGALVEAAAERIGANSLLARVMAYYHDLGKGCNSGYFIENQRLGQNPHDKLRPSMSAMIIRRHVTDGIALAHHYGLGEPITAGIAQHHGNTLIHVFYHKACAQAGPDEAVQEADFRYPGPKPQSREAALVMLGDSIEAASRAMADPNAARLAGLVNRIISGKFADGQLEECDLTLRDLHTIAKSFQTVLTGIYHHRLAYPDGLTERAKRGTRDNDSKSPRPTPGAEPVAAGPVQDHLKRLGLS